jgi:endonuclease/exonuclease/phosphatase family metal-dependent hydrolase
MVRIASYNVENLFDRVTAFDQTDPDTNQRIVAAYEEVNALFAKQVYSGADKARMLELLVELDVYYLNQHDVPRRRETTSPQWAWLRANRGKFDRQPDNAVEGMEIVATGRSSWIGWVELATESVDERATRMTARVISDLNADIIGVVEADDRPSLVRFNRELLGSRYRHIMLVDGNDERGIDVGIMTRAGFDIGGIRSNVDAEDAEGEIFSRDCCEYQVTTPDNTRVHVLVNHFKSQSGGGGPKRLRQATRVRKIVNELVNRGEHVVVLGDLNEGPAAEGQPAANLLPLYNDNTPLVECYELPGFDIGNRPGTYDSQGLRNRLDYLFVSKSLVPLVTGGGVFRKGVWGSRKTRPDAWDTYAEMTASWEQASDHAAVYLDLNI